MSPWEELAAEYGEERLRAAILAAMRTISPVTGYLVARHDRQLLGVVRERLSREAGRG